jgi:hypothetical protein
MVVALSLQCTDKEVVDTYVALYASVYVVRLVETINGELYSLVSHFFA